jgi:mRNA interferase RelE/StbE
MGSYKLRFKKSVAKDLRSIPSADLKRTLARIESLTVDPRPPGSEKLSGEPRYRIRQGTYRVLYEVRDAEQIILIVKVAHRREVYRKP